jgi:bifunctional DNA-binding transcriptional regulator/antitoxin component of YhaV-PrlF toxin-antitoxin module
MAKVTSKLQVTIPKRLAETYRIAPGDEIAWEAAGDVIRVVPAGRPREPVTVEDRLRLFDQATERQRRRERSGGRRSPARKRGWRREDLYRRGRAR